MQVERMLLVHVSRSLPRERLVVCEPREAEWQGGQPGMFGCGPGGGMVPYEGRWPERA